MRALLLVLLALPALVPLASASHETCPNWNPTGSSLHLGAGKCYGIWLNFGDFVRCIPNIFVDVGVVTAAALADYGCRTGVILVLP